MFKMGCSMARKILVPGSGTGSSSAGGAHGSSTGDDHNQPNLQQQHGTKDQGANNRGKQQQACASGHGKTKTGDELNDFSKLEEDPRLPLNVRQIFKITKSWKAIARTMSKTGTAMFLNLFEQNQDLFYLFDRFQHLKGKQELHESMELREHAATVMSTLDQSINLLSDYDNFVAYLHSIGKLHRKVPGFKREYFWKIEQPFLKAIKQTLDERCNETIEEIYKIAIKLIIETIADGYGQDDDNGDKPELSTGRRGNGGSPPDGGNGGNNTSSNVNSTAPSSTGKTSHQGAVGTQKTSSYRAGTTGNSRNVSTHMTTTRTGALSVAAGKPNQTLTRNAEKDGKQTVEDANRSRKMDNWMLSSTNLSECLSTSSCCPMQNGIMEKNGNNNGDLSQLNQLAWAPTCPNGPIDSTVSNDCIETNHPSNNNRVDLDACGLSEKGSITEEKTVPSGALLIGSACNLINKMTNLVESTEVELIESNGIKRECLDSIDSSQLICNTLLVALGDAAKASVKRREADEDIDQVIQKGAFTMVEIDEGGLLDRSKLPSRDNELVLCSMRRRECCFGERILLSRNNETINNRERDSKLSNKLEDPNNSNNKQRQQKQDSHIKIINSIEKIEHNYNDDPADGERLDPRNTCYEKEIDRDNLNEVQANKRVQSNINQHLARTSWNSNETHIIYSKIDTILDQSMKQKLIEADSRVNKRDLNNESCERLLNIEPQLTLMKPPTQQHQAPISARQSYDCKTHTVQPSFNGRVCYLATNGSMEQESSGSIETTIRDTQRKKMSLVRQDYHAEANKLIRFRNEQTVYSQDTSKNINNIDDEQIVVDLTEACKQAKKHLPLSRRLIRTVAKRLELQLAGRKNIKSKLKRTEVKLISSLNLNRLGSSDIKFCDLALKPGGRITNGLIDHNTRVTDRLLYRAQGDCRSHESRIAIEANAIRLANLSEAFQRSELVLNKLLLMSSNKTDLGEFIKMLILINKLILSLAQPRTLLTTTTTIMN